MILELHHSIRGLVHHPRHACQYMALWECLHGLSSNHWRSRRTVPSLAIRHMEGPFPLSSCLSRCWTAAQCILPTMLDAHGNIWRRQVLACADLSCPPKHAVLFGSCLILWCRPESVYHDADLSAEWCGLRSTAGFQSASIGRGSGQVHGPLQ